MWLFTATSACAATIYNEEKRRRNGRESECGYALFLSRRNVEQRSEYQRFYEKRSKIGYLNASFWFSYLILCHTNRLLGCKPWPQSTVKGDYLC